MFRISPGIGRVSPLFRLGRIGISPGMNRLKSLFTGISSYQGHRAKGAKTPRDKQESGVLDRVLGKLEEELLRASPQAIYVGPDVRNARFYSGFAHGLGLTVRRSSLLVY
jgi:hypothetical protein